MAAAITMEVYNSKVSYGLFIPVVAVFTGICIVYVLNGLWWPFLVIITVLVFVVYTFNTTRYSLSNGMLKIQSGIFYNKSIAVSTINKVVETRNPLSAPAASLDRLELFYARYEGVLLSPKDKAGFVAALQSINPALVVEWRRRQVAKPVAMAHD